MNPIVIYSTVGGNTEKVAKEIANELKCQSVKISEGFDSSTLNLNDFDFVYVGTGNIWGNPHAPLLDYLKEMNLTGNRRFALFIIRFGRGKSDRDVFRIKKRAGKSLQVRKMELLSHWQNLTKKRSENN